MLCSPLVSVIILCYKNFCYLYEAVDSVLKQTYENIEIIITNDCSDDFDEFALRQHLDENSGENIKNVIIKNNECNLGTVRNANSALCLTSGDYILIFAGDDAMYDDDVITRFVTAFDSLPDEELVVTSQLAMCDVSLKRIMNDFISDETKIDLNKLSPTQLFSKLSISCFIPAAGTCYKKKVFEAYGCFDETYFLVEDWSYFLKLSRSGVGFNYIDFISFKHRDGGVSHGNVSGLNSSKKKYDMDIISIMKNEVLPYVNLLDRVSRRKFYRDYKAHIIAFDYLYSLKDKSTGAILKYCITHLDIVLAVLIKLLRNKKWANACILLGAGILALLWSFDLGQYFTSLIPLYIVNWSIGLIGFVLVAYGIMIYFVSIVKILGKHIKRHKDAIKKENT